MEIVSTILFVLFCTYFATNLFLMVSAIWSVKNQLSEDVPLARGELPHVTIIVPAYNEKSTIVGTVKTILKQRYANFRLVVINDGSSDGTLETLVQEFGLELAPVAPKNFLLTKTIRGTYASKSLSRLWVLDKENGGKSDAINAGLNISSESSYVCVIDADVILEKSALYYAVQAIVTSKDGFVVAAGGNIRIGCGSDLSDGEVKKSATPWRLIHLLQILEYLRSFSLFRLGWNPLNSVAILSGAFGVFKRDQVMQLGGYQKFSKGEDMEITLRLHEHNLKRGSRYSIVQLVKPLCFTGAPSTLQELAGQRRRWQVGLLSCLKVYSHLLFRPRFGPLGLVALPYLLIFEAISPFLEISGYLLLAVNFFVLHQSCGVFLPFFAAVIGGALFVNIATVLTEAFILRLYTGFFDLTKLLLVGVLEPFGYHQLNQIWKIQATFGFFRNIQLKSTWQPPKRD